MRVQLTPATLARRALAATQTRNLPSDTDPLSWIQTHFYIPETNAPIALLPYQQVVLREAYRRDVEGKFVYSVVVWSDVKKSAKSSIAAAVALHRAAATHYGFVRIVANDLKQADSRVAYYARRAVELHPELRNTVKVKPSGYSITFPNRAVIEAVPIDPKGEAGGNDDLIIFSELWGANQIAAQRMWAEMTLSPMKFGYSQRWVESYAGFAGESVLLEQLYESGVKQGRQLDLGFPGLEVFANDAARMLCLWNTTPRCPWQTKEYYAQEQAVLPPNEFLRLHRNQWVSSVDTFVPPQWWDACRAAVPPLRTGIVVGIDAAVTNDSFGIVAVSRESVHTVAVRYARQWKPPPGGQIDFREPEAELRRLAKEHNVLQFAYDPYQLHDLCARLKRDGVGWFREFSQGAARLTADKLLHDVIRDRRIVHDGNLDLSEHVKNANAKTEGDKLRIVKRSDHLKIDLAVALSMATAEALRLNY